MHEDGKRPCIRGTLLWRAEASRGTLGEFCYKVGSSSAEISSIECHNEVPNHDKVPPCSSVLLPHHVEEEMFMFDLEVGYDHSTAISYRCRKATVPYLPWPNRAITHSPNYQDQTTIKTLYKATSLNTRDMCMNVRALLDIEVDAS